MPGLDTRKAAKRRWGLTLLFVVAWLLYSAAIVWYPIHESVAARERVAAADLARCGKHAASPEAAQFCQGDYARDLADAREIHWDRHPLWNPFWFAPLVLLLPPFGIFGVVWILKRGLASNPLSDPAQSNSKTGVARDAETLS